MEKQTYKVREKRGNRVGMGREKNNVTVLITTIVIGKFFVFLLVVFFLIFATVLMGFRDSISYH
jgi:hypothetical protein